MANNDRGKAIEPHESPTGELPASPATHDMYSLTRGEARLAAWRNLPWEYRYPFLRHQAAFPAKSHPGSKAPPPGKILRLGLALSLRFMVPLLTVAHLVIFHQIPPWPIWPIWPSHHLPSQARRASASAPAPLWQPPNRGWFTSNTSVDATGRHRRRTRSQPSRTESPLRFPPTGAVGLSGFWARATDGPFVTLPASRVLRELLSRPGGSTGGFGFR